MKICIICKNYNGGFKSFTDNLVSLLHKKGVETDILNIGTFSINIENTKTIAVDTIRKSNDKRLKPKLFLLICYLKKIFKKIESIALIKNKYIQRKYILYSNQFSSAKRVISGDSVFDMNEYDCVVSSEEITCNYFLSYSVKARKKICYVHPDYKMAGFDSYIDKFFFKKVNAICTVSLANAQSLKKAIPSLASIVYGIPNPIDVEMIINKASEKNNEHFEKDIKNIITVCRLDNTSKALDRLIAIAKRLKDDGLNFCWRIVGDGPFKDEMMLLIEKNNLKKEVIALGFKPNPIPLVRESDLFVLQSYYEGYPISVCESLIVNTPALITDFPAAKELVEDGKNGLIAKNNFEDIYEKLFFLLASEKALIDMKSNLNNISKDSFSNIDNFMKVVM